MRLARSRRGRPAACRWLSATGVRDREVVRCECGDQNFSPGTLTENVQNPMTCCDECKRQYSNYRRRIRAQEIE